MNLHDLTLNLNANTISIQIQGRERQRAAAEGPPGQVDDDSCHPDRRHRPRGASIYDVLTEGIYPKEDMVLHVDRC